MRHSIRSEHGEAVLILALLLGLTVGVANGLALKAAREGNHADAAALYRAADRAEIPLRRDCAPDGSGCIIQTRGY